MSAAAEVVQPDTLLTQLDALWAEFGKNGESAESGVARASSLTWIAVIEGDEASVTEVDSMLADVMRMQPGRALIILLRDGEERRLRGSVSAQCWRPFGSKRQVCIERVLLDATRASARDLTSVVRALLVADLPVVMFCRNAHLLAAPGIAETAKMADRVVVDIAWKGAECRDVWPKMPGFGRYVSDLAWDRIHGYRTAIAEHFATPGSRKILDTLTEVRVVTRPEHPTPEAAYLLTWILGSLGYKLEGGLDWQKAENTVKAGFVAAPESGPDNADCPVHAVEFVTQGVQVRFSVTTRELSVAPTEDAAGIEVPVPEFKPDTVLLSIEMMVEHRRRTFELYLEETIRVFEEPAYFADESSH